jgi:hypothetical protein
MEAKAKVKGREAREEEEEEEEEEKKKKKRRRRNILFKRQSFHYGRGSCISSFCKDSV